MTAAVRQIRYRQRAKAGRAVLSIEVDLVEVEELLIAANLLREQDRDDRATVEAAVEHLLQTLITDERYA
jgi:hypothetical protein